MTPDQINRAIAEECGWWLNREQSPIGYFVCALPPGAKPLFGGTRIEWADLDLKEFANQEELPDYHASLDACAEFERPMNHTQLSDYVALLIRELGVEEAITAPSHKRCEAFLRLKGKWE